MDLLAESIQQVDHEVNEPNAVPKGSKSGERLQNHESDDDLASGLEPDED